ncbi:hypothetical protein EC973_003075 [Apophysomyces ossiformis]|uniref:Uncharacterized protein n=1 Tax=Apophysomyces ossiformis TaxID=679940 RepID=A0A8H7BIB7_9FUNG|nr:hypothetical protein EC973_003075 [Apophysomyces ossiformis]
MTASLQSIPGGYDSFARLLMALLSLKHVFHRALRDGSRSPLDVEAKDDSIELSEEEMMEIVALLEEEEATLKGILEKVIVETPFDDQILRLEELSEVFNE